MAVTVSIQADWFHGPCSEPLHQHGQHLSPWPWGARVRGGQVCLVSTGQRHPTSPMTVSSGARTDLGTVLLMDPCSSPQRGRPRASRGKPVLQVRVLRVRGTDLMLIGLVPWTLVQCQAARHPAAMLVECQSLNSSRVGTQFHLEAFLHCLCPAWPQGRPFRDADPHQLSLLATPNLRPLWPQRRSNAEGGKTPGNCQCLP